MDGTEEATRVLTLRNDLFRRAAELVLYCVRHDYGTRVLMRTGNLAAVMRTMGHRDVKTAMHYQRTGGRHTFRRLAEAPGDRAGAGSGARCLVAG